MYKRGLELVAAATLGVALSIGAEAVLTEVGKEEVTGTAVPSPDYCDMSERHIELGGNDTVVGAITFPMCIGHLVSVEWHYPDGTVQYGDW